MRRSVVIPLIAAASFCGANWVALAAPSDSPSPPSPAERMQRWTEDYAALLTAKLAGLKAGLKLTADQQKLWDPFETSVRDAAQARQDRMKARMEARQKDAPDEGERLSPVERLDRFANRLSENGASLKKVADAAKPLYATLDDGQKRVFGFLSRELMMMGHPRMSGGPGPHAAWMGPHAGGPRGPGGKGMMRGPDGPGSRGMDSAPGDRPDEGPDSPDDE